MATATRLSLIDWLNEPEVAEVLHRPFDHAESLDQTLPVAGDLPDHVAIAADFFDAISRKASQDGINPEQRAHRLLKWPGQVTEPNNMRAIERLVSPLPKLEEGSCLLDEWAAQVKNDGIDLNVNST